MKKFYLNLFVSTKQKRKGLKTSSIFMVILALFAFLTAETLSAQTEGSTCESPLVITGLPFDDSGNTGTYGNNYTNTDVPPTAEGAVTNGTGSNYYLGSDEVVYSITPAEDGTINISITNDIEWTGLWVFTGCPFASTVGYHTAIAGDTRSINGLPVSSGTTYYIVVSNWDDPFNYTIEVTGDVALEGEEDCDELPDELTINAPESVCGGASFSMSPQDLTSGSGMTYQWQSKPVDDDDAEFENIEGATSKNLNMTSGITEATQYRVIVGCDNSGEEVISEEVSITIKEASECFCIPTYSTGCASNDAIDLVFLEGESETLDNQTDCSPGGYGDYTEMTAPDLAPGETYTITVGTSYTSPTNEEVMVWIDFNGNGTFEESEIIANTGGAGLPGGSKDFEFEVPEETNPGNYRMRVRLVYVGSGIADPCGSATYGETEDYTVQVIQLDDCEGPVVAGEPVEDEINICAGRPFSVAITGATDPANGLSRQWQSSPAGEDDWVDIEDAHSNSLNINEGVVEDTDFRYVVACSFSEESDTSDIIQVVLNPGTECYCTPVGGGNNADEIRNFSLSNIDHDSPASEGLDGPGYSDYTESVPPAILIPGESYVATVTAGTGSGNHGAALWIDYNSNGFFETSEMVSIPNNIPANGVGEFPAFTVPNTPGTYRLRVQLRYNFDGANLDPCTAGSTLTETEDYLVEIISLDACEGTPNAGTIMEDMNVCPNTNFNLVVTDASDYADGLDRQWQSSPAGEDDWTDIEGAGFDSYQLQGGINEPTDFRYVLTCSNSGESNTSDVVSVGINDPEECYCTPVGTNSSYYINNFTTTGGNENINNTNSGFSEGGYGEFLDMTLSQVQGESVDFSTSIMGGTAGFRIWVDWNKDGQFDPATEVVFNSTAYSANHSGSFEVPINAIPGDTRMRVVSHYLNSSGDIDPCSTAHVYGEFEDYTFNVIALEDCEGSPTAGTPDETEIMVCPNTAFTLSVNGASDPATGLTRQWQTSPPGEDDWTDVEGAIYPEYYTEDGITEDIDFRFIVYCENSEEGDVSEVIQLTINQNAAECYCTPAGTNSTYYINSFATTGANENISNTNTGFSDQGYGDYTDMTVSQIQGESINFNATVVGTTMGFRIWVDWNQDGYFDVDEEVVFNSSAYSAGHNGSFQVPLNAIPGDTRMRIACHSSNSTGLVDPCSTTHTGGEFEDYTFNVIALEDCEGSPTAGTPDETEMLVCPNSPFTLSVDGASDPATGLTRQWQTSAPGEDDWTDIDGAIYPEYYTYDGISEAADFRYIVYCENSEEGDVSEVIQLTINEDVTECYCIPVGTNTTRYIDNFSTTDGSQNIINNASGFSTNGYGDFTDMTVSQVPGESISFSADMVGGTFGVRIWIDWNQDGQFDVNNEVAYQSSSYLSTQSGTITVPENAMTGPTRMRVVSHYLSTTGDVDPCYTEHGNGEFEDYTFDVIPLEDCEGTPTAGTADQEDFDVCFEREFSLSVSGASDIANGLERNWQSSPAGEDDWTDIPGAISTNYFAADGITEATDFRYRVTCTLSGETDYSEVVSVELKPGVECYCIPTGQSNNGDEIRNFTLEEIDNDSAPSESLNGVAYSDYSESVSPAILIPGLSYTASLTAGTSSGNHGAAIWIDYNDNGVFEPSEMVASIGNTIAANSTVDFPEFTVESIPGQHRLRVMYRYNADGATLNPCVGSTYSEVEDYSVVVVTPDCFPPTNISMDFITDNSAYVSWDTFEGQNSWKVIYGEQGFDPETEGETIETDDPEVNITGLNGETTYSVYVQAFCDEDLESLVLGPYSFTTLITPPVNTRICDAIHLEPNMGCAGGPFTNVGAFEEVGEPGGSCLNNFRGHNSVWFTFEAPASGNGTLSTNFSQTQFNTEMVAFEGPADCEDMSTLGAEVACANNGNDLEFFDLNPGEIYYVKVTGFNEASGSFCIGYSPDGDMAPGCDDPSDIVVDDITDTSAQVSWTSNGDEDQWEVVYGLSGFDLTTEGLSMVTDVASVLLSDLEPETDYDVYVRAICLENLSSGWAGPEGFTTDELSVDNHLFDQFTFYPNPVENELILKAGNIIESVSVYNLLGQQVMEVSINNTIAHISTENLSSGIYMMKVNIDGAEKTFRIIKK